MTTPLPSIPYADDKPVALPFKDRRIGLRVMGAILIVIGGIAGLIAIAIPVMTVMGRTFAKSSGTVHEHRLELLRLTIVIVMYGGFGIFFFLAGIASIRIRRWVRPIILVVCWPWLVFGAVSIVLWVIALPEFSRSVHSSSSATTGPAISVSDSFEVVTFLSLVLTLLVIPGILVWFYGKSNVSLTLGYFDFRPSWTDRVPTPVIGISGWLLLTAAWECYEIFNPVVSMFGTILNGPAAMAVLALVIATCLLLAWKVFRQQPIGWWGTVVMIALIVMSTTMTHARHSALEYMAKAGFSEPILQESASEGGTRLSASLDTAIPLSIAILYLIYIRRQFIGVREAAVAPMAELSEADVT